MKFAVAISVSLMSGLQLAFGVNQKDGLPVEPHQNIPSKQSSAIVDAANAIVSSDENTCKTACRSAPGCPYSYCKSNSHCYGLFWDEKSTGGICYHSTSKPCASPLPVTCDPLTGETLTHAIPGEHTQEPINATTFPTIDGRAPVSPIMEAIPKSVQSGLNLDVDDIRGANTTERPEPTTRNSIPITYQMSDSASNSIDSNYKSTKANEVFNPLTGFTSVLFIFGIYAFGA